MTKLDEQLRMLHIDGYFDAENMLRDMANGAEEFEYMRKYAGGADFSTDVCREQLRSLWTAYCLHHGLDCDTSRYDSALMGLWEAVAETEPDTADWSDFDSFDGFMCRNLV